MEAEFAEQVRILVAQQVQAQQAQQAQQQSEPIGGTGIKSLVSTKLVEGIDKFAGEDERWKKFSSAFETCMSNVGLDEYMQTSSQDAVSESDLRWLNLPDKESQKMSKAL